MVPCPWPRAPPEIPPQGVPPRSALPATIEIGEGEKGRDKSREGTRAGKGQEQGRDKSREGTRAGKGQRERQTENERNNNFCGTGQCESATDSAAQSQLQTIHYVSSYSWLLPLSWKKSNKDGLNNFRHLFESMREDLGVAPSSDAVHVVFSTVRAADLHDCQGPTGE
ncbi:hypothetical protein F5884DRAFT_532917 [Xylogone sp. PMI_703]|nr:hypothetical protein F5884DRAFT_532917 [Xylogone sp. PMI_703]